ncbi:signal peptide peptidase SppA [Cystobacter ferrugineus]|uniref:Signal peptide peptidase A n=1 Tax=Cystobacter ferrugineus TaxID=83449 RepID=A0A1L9BAW0_9BACT|nr:signal peptide peptidase SppA [Cystobacter ferrugineus]OJH39404.1 signal peptide peptidase A [Cystobacter ferrugineus]
MRALSALSLLFPSLVLAQTGLILQPAVPPRGVTLPPTSAALVDEATALALNPASLRLVGPGQLTYLHERNLASDQVGDGLFLGTSLGGGLGAGFSLEWMRGRGLPDYRKTSFGLALGAGALSLGVGYHDISSADATLSRLSGFDLGLTLRPSRHVSVGAVVRDVNAPRQGNFVMPRVYNLAVGVRPLGERVTLGVDYAATEGNWSTGQLSYTARATVIPGVSLGAGVSHGLGPAGPLALQLSATLDSAHWGLTYAAGGATSGGADHVVAVRLSGQKYPAPRLGGGTVALLDLDDRLVARGGLGALLGGLGSDPYLELMRWLDGATRDERLRGVVLKVAGLPGVDWGKADELHQAILRLRAAGKRVMAVLYQVDDKAYFVGAAADEVYALSASSLLVNGLSAQVTYLGGTMEKLGVSWDVARVGDYKTAPEQLTRRDLSPAQRETLEAFLDTQTAHDVERVTKARRLTPERLREAWSEGILTANRAKELGLVDGVLTPEEFDTRLEALVPGARYDARYSPRDERDPRWSPRRRIAVVPVLGTIVGGKSRQSPLGGELSVGAETVVLALERAQHDPSVAAIVVRVDSGGGEVLASDLMYRAVLEAKKHKPVIASMGDVAASGGYYAAMGADEVWASPTTLTGSIGVFFLKPALRGLLGDKLGVNAETIGRAPMPDLVNLWRPWTEPERKAMQAWVDSAYDDFITQVSLSRKLDKARVDAIARGRVWTGVAARERGLVDQLGGLMEAVEAARKRAGVPADEEVELKVIGDAGSFFSALGGEPGVGAVLRPAPEPLLPPTVQAFLREAGLESPWMLEPGLKAVQPYTLSVR